MRLSPPPTTVPASEGGKRLFRTRDGNVVELPPDMTPEDAARLEAEATAAQTQLGKGPPPQPVPDVKKLGKKEEKKDKSKPEARGKRDDRGKGKASPRAGAAATAVLKVGSSKVAQYLSSKGTPVLTRGVGMLRKLRQNEQTHDDAGEKLQQSEKAVVIPSSEGQSKSNTGQVNTVSGRPTPTADDNKAKQKLQESLQKHIPQSIEDADNFKRDAKAQHMGADVMTVVQGDKKAVISTFADMEQTPPPAPSEHTPEALPPEEVAPPTANMNLGQGAIAPLQKEHTDLSNYTKEADGKLKEEGVTQEQLDMVDSGDLAAANKEKKGMETTAKTEPLAVQKFVQQEATKADRDLVQEEKKERDGLRARRKANLGATTQKQKGTKSALEKKREEVAGKINGIYKNAQDKVKKKLADLETQSMKRFDDGNTKATQAFEDNVKRELDAYKADRYSGFWGDLKRAKDWLLGMDDLPGVKAIFDRNRATFVNTINKLVEDITADNKRVIQECKDELANAKQAIKEYVDKLAPDLKDMGKKAAEEMNAKLDELDRFVAKKEQELQDKLKDKQQAAIKAINEKIEKMKEAMAGALAKLGKLLLLAAKKFFTWALEKFGFSLADIEGIINKGVAVLKAIFTQPIQFVKNLVRAASTGLENFRENFLTHLKDAVFDWLTGSLEGIQLPSSWDPKGIASVALQMLGLTWRNIRGKLVKLTNETTVKTMETGFDLVVTLVKEGPMAAWERLKDMANDIKEAFLEGVKDFIKIKIIQEAIKTIVALFVPGAGIIRAIIGIYDTIVFFIQKAKQIAQMLGNFLGSIAEIAAGNIGAAAAALEKGLATALKLVINFLAKFLRLDGITAKIRNAIQKLGDKVDKMLDRVAEWVVGKAKKLGSAAIRGARTAAGRVLGWLGFRKQFSVNNQPHSLSFDRNAPSPTLVLATTPVHITSWLNVRREELRAAHQFDTTKERAYNAIQRDLKSLGGLTYRPDAAASAADQEKTANTVLDNIAMNVAIIGFSGSTVPVPRMVVTPGFSSQKAANMTVQFLFNDPNNHRAGRGTSGNESLLGAWAKLAELGISRSYWKSGHMLNVTFGGPPENSNLIPMPQSVNMAQASFDRRITQELYEQRKPTWIRFVIRRDHPQDAERHFVSYFKAEAAEMPLRDGRYQAPATGNIIFEKSGGELPYPAPRTAPVTLNGLIRSGDRSREAVAAVAGATQLSAQLVGDLVQRGTVLNNVEEIVTFIRSKSAEYGEIRVARYLAAFERHKGSIVL